MKDYSNYPFDNVYLSGAERKNQITINGNKYIIKFQKNSENGKLFNHISEYLGSHVFNQVGIPVQETKLGTYNNENIVLLRNFLKANEVLVPFNGVGESSIEANKETCQYSYEDIQKMLSANRKLTDVSETISRFWDIFIVDALNGNFDRHGGNWGFIKSNSTYSIAPVYDNGSCMYPRLNTAKEIKKILESKKEINDRIYNFPTSQIKLHGQKSSYYDVINSLEFDECNKALSRIYPRIDLNRIDKLIDSIEGIDDIRKIFYKKMYEKRYELILRPAYEKLSQEQTC